MTDQATMLSTAAGRMIGRLAQRRIGYRNLGDGPHSSTQSLAASTTSRLSSPLTDMQTDSGDFAFGSCVDDARIARGI
jgi:hypothetical protein